MASDRLYFRQLLSGLDLGEDDMIAQQMVNFVYLVGDRETGEAVAIDPAYDIAGDPATSARPTACASPARWPPTTTPTTSAAASMGHGIAGHRASCSSARRCRSTCRPTRPSGCTKATGVGVDRLVATHASGDTVMVGEIPITLIHTPGHTPGSQCFLVDGRLVAGDTLFLDGCGRTDLPGGDPEQMYLQPHPAARPGARRRRALPRPPLLGEAVGHRWPRPAAATWCSARRHAGAVADDVRELT